MGSAHSQRNSFYKKSASRENFVTKEHSIPVVYDFTDNPVVEELLIEILSYMSVTDLIVNCRLVCKQWKYLVDSQSVWRRKCERDNVKLPSLKLQQFPDHYYRNLYIHFTSNKRNLIKNPCGEEKFEGWELRHNVSFEGVGFAIENPPAGADPVPAEVGSQSCFATTYYNCEKYQNVKLRENPINDYLLQHDLVTIKVGEWYAARFDCASQYELQVVLYNKDHDVIDQFEFSFVEEQWNGKEWHLVTHEFTKVTDAHFIRFFHQGRDRQFWAGHYGSKMTGAFVELCLK